MRPRAITSCKTKPHFVHVVEVFGHAKHWRVGRDTPQNLTKLYGGPS